MIIEVAGLNDVVGIGKLVAEQLDPRLCAGCWVKRNPICGFGGCNDRAVVVMQEHRGIWPEGERLCRLHLHMLRGGMRHVGCYADGAVRVTGILEPRRRLPNRHNVAVTHPAQVRWVPRRKAKITWLTTKVLP